MDRDVVMLLIGVGIGLVGGAPISVLRRYVSFEFPLNVPLRLVGLSLAVVLLGVLRATTMGIPFGDLVDAGVKLVLGVAIGILSCLLFLELFTRRRR